MRGKGQRSQPMERGNQQGGRNAMMHGTMLAQSLERGGLEGITWLSILGLFVAIFASVFYLFRGAFRVVRVVRFCLRVAHASRQAGGATRETRARGRRRLQSCAVLLRDRPSFLLHRGGFLARYAFDWADKAGQWAVEK